MPVRAELTGRRLVVALLLIAVLPALLAITAVMYTTPALPPGPPAYNPLPLARNDLLSALQARELQRSRKMAAMAPTLSAPQLVAATFPQVLPTIVLPARPDPYTLGEVQKALPAAFTVSGDTTLVTASIEVPTGARLNIDGTTPNVRLVSSSDGFATIIARGGVLDIAGTAQSPVAVTSWDPTAGVADSNTDDGRAFLLTLGGRMDITDADVGYLGFGTGTSSGAAWRSSEHTAGAVGVRALGDVSNSVFHNNWFGAYTFEAEAMRWLGNTFADNKAYGFDPHDVSNDFLVQGNIAHGNGRHGFIFSRGCDNNILRDNVSYNNRGHGFMIDDGRSEDSATASATVLQSDNNELVGNRAYNNDGSGIEIEGGTGTLIRGNSLSDNHVGIRVKNDASVDIVDNTITDSALAGVDVLAGGGSVGVHGNTIAGGWASIALEKDGAATVAGNTLTGASTQTVIAGQAIRQEDIATRIGRLFHWNPLLVLWTAILGIPLILGVRSLVRHVGRRLRTPVPARQ